MPTFLKSSLLSVVVRVLAVVLAGQCLATVHLGVEHFQQKTPMAQQSQQRAIITFGQTLNLGGPLKALVDLDLISTSTNTKQYIAVEQARDFFVEVREFSVNRGFNPIGLELNTKVGFFALGSDIAAQKNLNGPGASVALKGDTSNISTSFLLLPSYEQYYIKDNTDSQSSTLWSVQAHKRLAIRDSLNAFLFFGYDYFSELGTEAAFRSKLRNNSVRGDIVKAEFVYDYSIF
ncbi:MAG: hypothetical protein KDD61_06965, partial [Bdellovibrionales bacterium]|nr:hypothetical protein [Bdellovibrionales bacterium]